MLNADAGLLSDFWCSKEWIKALQKQFKNVTIFLLLVLMVVSLYMISADTQPQARELSYMGEFRPMVTQGQIASVEVRPQGNDTTVYTGKL